MRRWIVILAIAASVAGCSFDRPLGYRAVNTCSTDAQCVTGLCYEGVCASPPENPLKVSLQVITAPSDLERAPASSVLGTLTVVDNAREDLTVGSVARVSGKVRFRGKPVPATLSFSRPSLVPGGPGVRVDVDTGDPFGDGSADYVASLPADETFDLEIRVSGALFESTSGAPELDASAVASRQLPPMIFQGMSFGSGNQTFDVHYAPTLFEPCDETIRTGCELSGALTAIGLDDLEAPVSGVEVRAVDSVTGRVISSTASVVDGAFSIRISPFDGPYDLLVVPGLNGSAYRATTFPAGELALPIELLIRRYPVVRYEALLLDEEDHAPVPLATVSFQSEAAPDPLSGVLSVYRTSTLSGEGAEAGKIKVDLQPGVFKVVITPVETQDLAIHLSEVIIPDAEGTDAVLGQAFELERRSGLHLYLSSFDGLAVDLVDVQAVPRAFDPKYSPDVAAFARSSQSTTDADGNSYLPIDLGIFDLFARPVSSRGFPFAYTSVVGVDEAGEWMSRELVIPAPTVLAGTIRATDGEPLGNATLRAFVAIDDENGERLLRMGETTSGSDGSYRLLLPSRL
jgi:hypothetical protein